MSRFPHILFDRRPRLLCRALFLSSVVLVVVACGNTVSSPTVPGPAGTSADAASSAWATGTAPAVPQAMRYGGTDVCHRTGSANNAFVLLTVAAPSVPAHIQHGDGLVGEPVPGRPGMVFGADCTPITSSSCTSAPGAPGFLGWTTAGLSSGSVELSWGAATGTVTAYVLEVGTTVGGTDVAIIDTASTATSYVLTGLQTSVDYYHVRVRARNACGISGPSNEANPRVA